MKVFSIVLHAVSLSAAPIFGLEDAERHSSVAWTEEEEKEQLWEWHAIHHHRGYPPEDENNPQRRVRSVNSFLRHKNQQGQPSADHPYAHPRKLKDKTDSMFAPTVATSKSLSSTKAPTCKSTKGPASSKSSKAPKSSDESECSGVDGSSSNTPSELPSEEPSTSFGPSLSTSPSERPSLSSSPSSQPSKSQMPSATPSTSTKPSSQPSLSNSPSVQPSTSVAPSNEPSKSQVPSAAPSTSTKPSDQPSLSSSPSMQPSTSVAPSDKPSISHSPSSMPSRSQNPSMAPSEAPPRCITGNASYVISQCQAFNLTCCTGTNACSFDNATICRNSCNGGDACASIGSGAYIDEGSCNGLDRACTNMGGSASFVTVGKNSCNGDDRACTNLGLSASRVVIGEGSCNADSTPCYFACGNCAGEVEIGDSSCLATYACAAIGYSELYIGSNSCKEERACFQNFYTYSIGNNSCGGLRSCEKIGRFVTPVTVVSIGSNACNPDFACQEFAYDPLVDPTGNVSIGNGACNVVKEQCSGNTDAGYNGTNACFIANGTYMAMIPPNGMFC